MIRLTEWETGEPVFIAPSVIVAIQQLQSSVSQIGESFQELGRRTRIDTTMNIILVKEDAERVVELIKNQK